ncbi:hypothetical protein DFH27DRAFT_241805 [Peziza echinospora]|nr:hypothetical protein DFH27DRAFT_241805 [Peziza echinospora]
MLMMGGMGDLWRTGRPRIYTQPGRKQGPASMMDGVERPSLRPHTHDSGGRASQAGRQSVTRRRRALGPHEIGNEVRGWAMCVPPVLFVKGEGQSRAESEAGASPVHARMLGTPRQALFVSTHHHHHPPPSPPPHPPTRPPPPSTYPGTPSHPPPHPPPTPYARTTTHPSRAAPAREHLDDSPRPASPTLAATNSFDRRRRPRYLPLE